MLSSVSLESGLWRVCQYKVVRKLHCDNDPFFD
jgi:hypothetical protein